MFYQAPVDAYGFERPGNFDYDSYEKFMDTYLAVLQRRAGRWKKILGEEVEKEKLHSHMKVVSHWPQNKASNLFPQSVRPPLVS